MSMTRDKSHIPSVKSELCRDMIEVPTVITRCNGINVNGRKLKSFLFTTDIATICNTDADAILAIYPFTPHPGIIHQANTSAVASMPVLAGVSGGMTQGTRSATISLFAESLGSIAVVVNAPTPMDTIRLINKKVDIPVVGTIVSIHQNIQNRLDAGVDILNVSGGLEIVSIIKNIRKDYPFVPIIATGSNKDENILATIEADANAISYTPPTNAEIFKKKMEVYRQKAESHIDK